tara:strand:- start:2202 stop:2747 length:546 start_codon:yes stop_codon:yes gene_type:complete
MSDKSRWQKEVYELWRKGEINGSYKDLEGLADYLIDLKKEEVGNKCEKCGYDIKNEYTGRAVLEHNHIDENPYNNEYSNIEILCRNCHGEVTMPTRKELGKIGRGKRKKLVKDGIMTSQQVKGNKLPNIPRMQSHKRKKRFIPSDNQYLIAYKNLKPRVPIREGFRILAKKLHSESWIDWT